MIQSIRKLIALGLVEDAIQELRLWVPTEWQNDVILLQGQIAQLARDERNDLIAYDEARRRTAKFSFSVLKLCDEIEAQQPQSPNLVKEKEVNETAPLVEVPDPPDPIDPPQLSSKDADSARVNLYFCTTKSNHQRKSKKDLIQFIHPSTFDSISPHKQEIILKLKDILNTADLNISIAEEDWQKPIALRKQTGSFPAPDPSPKLFILLAEKEDFTAEQGTPNSAKNLTQIIRFFRRTCLANKGIEELRNNSYDYQPILTLSLENIMSLFSEDEPEQDFRRSLNLDHRIKYLDSSIWNRYIPFFDEPENPLFDKQFLHIVQQMLDWHAQGLYRSVAAITTLEFQTRMLLNSFIAKVGEKGHNELVRPFKFHSETQMQRKANKIADFLSTEREGGISLKKSLNWNFLLVDDQANTKPMSTLGEQKYPDLKKSPLIENVLRHDLDNFSLDTPSVDHEIVQEMIDKLKKGSPRSYDVIFLDYLLGSGKLLEREYGHHFLLKLIDTPALQRGPFNRHWILPISSFPHAFTDKLNQLGVNHLSDWWHLSNGGDPICTPELFRHSVLTFLQQQINVCFYDKKMLIQNIQKFNYLEDFNSWIEAVQRSLLSVRANRDQLYRKTKSAFCLSFITFINSQIDFIQFEDDILKFLRGLASWSSNAKLLSDVEAFKKKYPDFIDAFPANFDEMLNAHQRYKVFILASSHEKDSPYLEMVANTIKGIRDYPIDSWQIEQVDAGLVIDDVIQDKIQEADIFLVLLSSDFMAEDKRYNLLRDIEKTGRPLIPILCRHCSLDQQLQKLKILPQHDRPISEWTNPDLCMKEMAREIIKNRLK